MAKNQKNAASSEVAVTQPKGKKPQNFKLGDKASLFYDPVSKKKVLPGQVVEFDAKQMSTDKFKAAKKHGHLEQASDEDVTKGEEVNEDLVAFMNQPDKETKVKYITDNWDVSAEDTAKLEALTDDELLEEFKASYLD